MFLCAFHCTIYTGNLNNRHNWMHFNLTLFKAISYTVRARTAEDKDGGTEAMVYVTQIKLILNLFRRMVSSLEPLRFSQLRELMSVK